MGVHLDADRPGGFTAANAIPVFSGDPVTAYKDPVVLHDGERWHAWVCCHEVGDPAEADAMYTRYATSGDGLRWDIATSTSVPRRNPAIDSLFDLRTDRVPRDAGVSRAS